jgi:acyl carrier protein
LPLRSQAELDSMDYLTFIVAIYKQFGVNIPETDYSKIQSINSLIQYIKEASRTKLKESSELRIIALEKE